MDMIYQDNVLFVDLSGEIDIDRVKSKLFSVAGMYKIKDVVLYVTDVFNYKRRDFYELKNDYSRVYGGNLVVKR